MPVWRRAHWPVSNPATRARMARVVALARANPGMLHREIGAALGHSRGHVSDLLARAVAEGLIEAPPAREPTPRVPAPPSAPAPANPLARHGDTPRDAEILRLADARATMAQIGAAVGMHPKSVHKRLQTLRERRKDAEGAAEATRAAPPGWPKKLRCPFCREWRTCTAPGDRYHVECRRRAAAWDTGADPALSGASWRGR